MNALVRPKLAGLGEEEQRAMAAVVVGPLLVRWDGEVFSLTRPFDQSDESYMENVACASRFLPEWKAVIQGGSSSSGSVH